MLKKMRILRLKKDLTIWDNLNQLSDRINLSKMKGYTFKPVVFRVVFVILLLYLFFVAGGFQSETYINGNLASNVLKNNIYVSCPKDSVTPCKNTLFQNAAYCGKSIPMDSYICNNEFLLQGAAYGNPPSFIVKNWGFVIFVLICCGFVFNHFFFNSDFDYKKFWNDNKNIFWEVKK
jgi:hypothetical protein